MSSVLRSWITTGAPSAFSGAGDTALIPGVVDCSNQNEEKELLVQCEIECSLGTYIQVHALELE